MVVISPHLKLAFAWITAANQLNVTQLASMMSEDFISIPRPASLNAPRTNKTAYLAQLKTIPIQTFNISLPATADIVETPDVVQFYTTSNGRTLHGFPWTSEYVFTFTYASDTLIKSVAEFVDATVVTSQFGKEAIVAEAKFNCP